VLTHGGVRYADGIVKGLSGIFPNKVNFKHNKWYEKEIRKLSGERVRTIALAFAVAAADDGLALSPPSGSTARP